MQTDFNILTAKRRERDENQTVSVKKTDNVLLSEQLLDIYYSERLIWANQALKDDDFFHGQQWTQTEENDLKARGYAPIVVNVLYPTVEQAKAMLTTQNPRFAATAREDSDNKTAQIFSDLMAYIWDISKGNTELKQAIQDYYVRGLGYLMAYTNPYADFGKGEVYIKNVDPFDVYVDPNSKDIHFSDAAHIIISKLLTIEQFQTSYPQFSDFISQMQRTTWDRRPSNNLHNPEDQRIGLSLTGTFLELIDRYSKIKKMDFKIIYPSLKEEVYNDEEFKNFLTKPAIVKNDANGTQFILEGQELEQLLEIYNTIGAVFHTVVQYDEMGNPIPQIAPGEESENAVPNSQVNLQLITMQDAIVNEQLAVTKILSDKIFRVMSCGGMLLYEETLDLEEYPIVPFCNRHRRSPYPMSDVRMVRGLQEYINHQRSLIIAHAANSTSPKVILPKGSINRKEVEQEFGKAGIGIIEANLELGTPHIVSPIPLPNELYKNEADARNDIREILGIYPFQQGDTSNAPPTYKGTMALDEFGQRRIKSKIDDIESSLNVLAKVIVRLIQKTYTEHKVIRLLSPNKNPVITEINVPIFDNITNEFKGKINDITIGKCDIQVVSGSTLPSNRWARAEYYMDLYTKGIIDQVEVLKQTEVADIEGVLQRFGIISKLQQQVAQLEQELKKVSGDLQTAQRESVQDRKRVEVEKFKSDLKGIASGAEASAMLYKNRLEDDRKLQQKEFDMTLDEIMKGSENA